LPLSSLASVVLERSFRERRRGLKGKIKNQVYSLLSAAELNDSSQLTIAPLPNPVLPAPVPALRVCPARQETGLALTLGDRSRSHRAELSRQLCLRAGKTQSLRLSLSCDMAECRGVERDYVLP
jgi:hypothetical protein